MRHAAAMFVAMAFAPAGGAAAVPASPETPALEVAVVDPAGQPIPDAVVTLLANAGLDTGPGVPQVKTIDQRALQFDPYIEVFRPGDQVVFRNSDATNHHVYSFSPVKPFETMVSPGQSSAPMTLEAPGVVAVGCNIHDRMVTYLYVGDAPFVARTGADGLARFAALPDGAWTIRVWHPRSRAPGQVVERAFSAPAPAAARRQRFAFALRPDVRLAHDRETLNY